MVLEVIVSKCGKHDCVWHLGCYESAEVPVDLLKDGEEGLVVGEAKFLCVGVTHYVPCDYEEVQVGLQELELLNGSLNEG